MRRLALFMDGTWNDPETQTNVRKLYERIAPRDAAGIEQLTHYVNGVGTKWHEKIRGGAFGLGLSRNVRTGYDWLVENYRDGDQIYVFGFSRGAYTARSVVGFMSRCGLLRQLTGPISSERLFERYKGGKKSQRIPGLKEINQRIDEGQVSSLSDEDLTLAKQARRVQVEFIGVWDTVGALGIPSGKIWLPANRTRYEFHDVELSSMVRNACQAVAVDEHRLEYEPSLWTQFVADNDPPRRMPHIEQRWFAGAHSNVGGGYKDNRLSDLPLAWMAERCGQLGLALRDPITLQGDEFKQPAVDSFGEFLWGVYAWIKDRHYRRIDAPAVDRPGGRNLTINQTLDPSVFDRWRTPGNAFGSQQDAGNAYRPPNLQAWANDKNADPDQLTQLVSVSSGAVMPLDDQSRFT